MSIFGPISEIIYNPITSVSVLIGAFSTCLVSLAFLTGGFIGFKTAFTGSSEGNIFGEKMSSIHTPVKIVGGLAFLIPDSTGYSTIQHFVFWVILNGVGFANQLWNQVAVNYEMGNSLTVKSSSASSASSQIESVTKDLFYIALVSSIVENKSTLSPTHVTPKDDYINFKAAKKQGYVCDANDGSSLDQCENQSLSAFPVQEPSVNNQKITTQELAIIFNDFIERIKQDPLIIYAFTNNLLPTSDKKNFIGPDNCPLDPGEFFGNAACYNIIEGYENDMITALLPYVANNSSKEDANSMISNGWLAAAFYYWTLSQPSQDGSAAINSLLSQLSHNAQSEKFAGTILPAATLNPPKHRLGDNYRYKEFMEYREPVINYINNIFEAKNKLSSSAEYTAIINSSSTAGLDSLMKISATNFLVGMLIPQNRDYYAVNYDFSKDRFSQFIKDNAKVIEGVITFIQVMAIITFIMTLSTFYSGMSPLWNIIVYFVCTLTFMLIPFMTMIMGTAVMGSIYVALLPGLIFAAGVLSWFIKVIEMVVAAPIVSLAAMIPSEDDTAKIQHACMQLLVVTLRPALMIIGYVLASKLVQINIMFIGGAYNYLGQELSIDSNAGGVMFLIMMYEFTTLTTVSVISRSFNLINMLPDQVFMMMSVQSSDQESQGLVNQFEDNIGKATESFNQVFSSLAGLSKAANDGLKKMNDKKK
jgi:conjugal transfer/type IV secretion protein DotA/TraY